MPVSGPINNISSQGRKKTSSCFLVNAGREAETITRKVARKL